MNESPSPLSVLRYREFRLLWTGQIFSMIGSRMQGAALLWQLYDVVQAHHGETAAKFALGYMGLARVIPIVLFALVGGVIADVHDRRRLMLAGQSTMALLAAVLGTWSLIGLHHAWPIYAVAALNGAAGAFESPARQSLLPSLVPRERLAHAVSLNSITSQLASIVGPTLMGLVILRYSVGVIYWINALSFLAVIWALLIMRPEEEERRERPQPGLQAVVEGLRFMRHSRLLVSLMLLDFIATFFASANTLLPAYTREVLHTGPREYGLLVAAASFGSLPTAGIIALLPTIRHQGRIVLSAVFIYGIATILFGVGGSFWPCFLALAATGASDTVSTVLRQTIRQLVTPPELRGRMTSINLIFFQGGPQLGELEAGIVAGAFGTVFSVVSGGVACMAVVAGMAWLAPWLRKYEGHDDAVAGT